MTAELPKELAGVTFGDKPRTIALDTFEAIWRLANVIILAGWAPAGMDTPEKVTVAIMHGAELGMPPMMSVQRIAVIGGRPTVWGDGAMALVESSGLLEDIEETIEGEGDNRVAICTVTRKGRKPKTSTFSVADAKQAGLWDDRPTVKRKMKYDGWFAGKMVKAGEWADLPNDSPWFKYQERMLTMRARGYRLRDSFSDRLGGLYLREELDDGLIEGTALPPPARRERLDLSEPPGAAGDQAICR